MGIRKMKEAVRAPEWPGGERLLASPRHFRPLECVRGDPGGPG